MHFYSLIVIAAVALQASANEVVSLFNGVSAVDATIGGLNETHTLARRVSYDCKGSTLCKGLSVDQCDAAYRTIVPGNVYKTGGAAGNTGVCNGHCGIFVQKSNCAFSGTALQNAYHALRNNGCAKCGSEHEDNGCLITINYVTGC